MKEFEVEIFVWGYAYSDEGLDSGDFDGSFEHNEEMDNYDFEGAFNITVKAETEVEAKDFAECEYEKANCGTLREVGHDFPEIKEVRDLPERNREGGERK